jgi:hypothetical protein
MSEANENAEAAAMDALQVIISALGRLDEKSRERVLQSVATFFGTTVSVPVQREASRP